MIGTLTNTAAIIVGSSIGIFLRKTLLRKYESIYFQAVGLFTFLLGIQMSIGMSSPLLLLFSLIVGGFTGAKINLEEKIDRLGQFLKVKIKSQNERFAEGLTTAFLLFCMGSMTIVGAIEEGFGKPPNLLITKSILDFFSSQMLASALGLGVLFSFIPMLLFQGGITLFVSLVGKNIPPEIITEITAAGGILLIGLSFNLLQIKKLNVVNLLPSLLFICLFVWLKSVFGY